MNNSSYGGIPEGGGYHATTEYEIGAQIIGEAIHCILGSLYKATTPKRLLTESKHIHEELKLVRYAVGEYRKDLYMEYFLKSRLYTESFNSIKKASLNLLIITQEQSKLLVKSSPLYKLAKICYDTLDDLAIAMLESLNTGENAFWNNYLRGDIFILEKEIKLLYGE